MCYLTNKFYVAVHLFINVKMWQEQESGTRGTAECANEVIDTYWHLQSFITVQLHGNMEPICFM